MDVLLSGDGQDAADLEAALRERGLAAQRCDQHPALAGMMVAVEEALKLHRPRLALGVGSSDASLALAIAAPKLGVPFASWLDGRTDDRPDERRILLTLSEVSTAFGGDIPGAAERIAARFSRSPRSET